MPKAAQKKTHATDAPTLTFSPGLVFSIESHVMIPLDDLSNSQLSLTAEAPVNGVSQISGSLTRTFEISGHATSDNKIYFTLEGVHFRFAGVIDSSALLKGAIYPPTDHAGHGANCANGEEGIWSAQAPRIPDVTSRR